jgi:hypothetical protein
MTFQVKVGQPLHRKLVVQLHALFLKAFHYFDTPRIQTLLRQLEGLSIPLHFQAENQMPVLPP